MNLRISICMDMKKKGGLFTQITLGSQVWVEIKGVRELVNSLFIIFALLSRLETACV